MAQTTAAAPAAHANRRDEAPLDAGSLPDPVDLPGDGRRCRYRLSHPRRRGLHQPVPGRHDQHSHRHRPDPDDVPALRQGEVRAPARGVSQHEGAGALAAAELDHRPDPDVRAGGHLPARLSRVHDRPDPDRPGALHRHGDRVERTGEGRHRIRGRTGGVQQRVPGAVLQRLRLRLHHRAAPGAGPARAQWCGSASASWRRPSSSTWASP